MRIAAIKALGDFSESHHSQVLAQLRRTAEEGRQGDQHLFEIALDQLAQIDIGELRDYLDHPLAKHAAALVCAEQGILVFDNGYVDREGKRHDWQPAPAIPRLNPDLPATQQREVLRAVCHYLVNRGMATKAGKYVIGRPVPLFRQNTNAGLLVDSIDKKTGEKFMDGGDLKPETAQRLMDWILKKYPIDRVSQ